MSFWLRGPQPGAIVSYVESEVDLLLITVLWSCWSAATETFDFGFSLLFVVQRQIHKKGPGVLS